MLLNKTLNYACNILWGQFNIKAPRDKGNLSFSMQVKPIYLQNKIAIIRLGSEWSSRTNQKYRRDFNYGTLLQKKRTIKNRESKDNKTRMQNRRDRTVANTRNCIVKDTKNGKTLRMSSRQLSINMRKRKTGQQPNYILQQIDYNIPVKKATIPYRVNRHYHYIDDIFDEYCKVLANHLGGRLYRGDYNPSVKQNFTKTTKNPKELLKRRLF